MNALTATLLFAAALVLIAFAFVPSIPAVRFAATPRRTALNDQLSARLRMAGIYHQAPSFVLGGVIGVALLAGMVTFALAGHIAGALIGLLLTPLAFYMALIRRERSFLRRATKELIPFFNRFEASVRAKVPPAVAYRQAVENGSVLRVILGESAARMAAGEEFTTALESTVDRFPLRIWRIFVAQLVTHETSGGELAKALNTTVAELNEMISIQAEAQADTASDRAQQIIISGIVIVAIFLFTLVIGKETMSRLWTHPLGIVGALAGLLTMAGGFWMTLAAARAVERKTIGEQ